MAIASASLFQQPGLALGVVATIITFTFLWCLKSTREEYSKGKLNREDKAKSRSSINTRASRSKPSHQRGQRRAGAAAAAVLRAPSDATPQENNQSQQSGVIYSVRSKSSVGSDPRVGEMIDELRRERRMASSRRT